MTAVHRGGRVLLTRPVGRADDLAEHLREAGFDPDHHPFVQLVPEADTDLREAVADLAAGRFAWLVLTSAVAVEALAALSATSTPTVLSIGPATRVAVVGEATAAALREHGVEPTLVAHGSGASLVDLMPAPAEPGETVLFPASSAAADTVPAGLAAAGYRVQRETAYRPVSVALDPSVPRDLRRGAYAAIVLTSPMIARLAAALPLHLDTAVVTIGEPTTLAARDAGLRVDAQASSPSTDGLVAAVSAALSASGVAPSGPGALRTADIVRTDDSPRAADRTPTPTDQNPVPTSGAGPEGES